MLYFQPEGRVYPVLISMLADSSSNLTLAQANNSKTATKTSLKDLNYILENVCYQITEIMVRFTLF